MTHSPIELSIFIPPIPYSQPSQLLVILAQYQTTNTTKRTKTTIFPTFDLFENIYHEFTEIDHGFKKENGYNRDPSVEVAVVVQTHVIIRSKINKHVEKQHHYPNPVNFHFYNQENENCRRNSSNKEVRG
jgi:hypothetical protein